MKKRSRLVFLLPDIQGGVRSYVTNLVAQLHQAGVAYQVIEYQFVDSLLNETRNDRSGVQCYISRYATFGSQARFLASDLKSDDILICNDSFELEVIDALRLPNKVIFILHGDLKHYSNTLSRFISLVDHVVCVSSGLSNKYQSVFPTLTFSVSNPFVLRSCSRKERKGADLNGIFIGRFEYLKGADLFLETITTCKTGITWNVICPLEGNDPLLMKRLPDSVNVKKGLSNEAVMNVLEEMDLLIFPSRSEGFGMAVLESMAQGVLPIALDIPIGIPDQIRHGYNGFMIGVDDWRRAAEIVEQLIGDRTTLLKLQLNAIQYAKEKFDPVNLSNEFVKATDAVGLRTQKAFTGKTGGAMESMLPEFIYRRLKRAKQRIAKVALDKRVS